MNEKPLKKFRYWPGDLVKFCNRTFSEVGDHELGLVVRRDFTDAREPAVLVTFPHTKGQEYHYYDLELQEWERDGTIEVQRA